MAAAETNVRDLVWTVIRTDFKVRYHGTLGGFVWALAKPLVMFVLLMSVFSFLFASQPNYKLDLIIGLFVWEFFADATKTGMISLHTKGFLLGRAKFPAWILIVTSLANATITLVVFSVVILAFLIGFGAMPSPGAIALFVFYLAALLLIVIGFALGASVLFLRYLDLNQVWDVAIQAGFFIAPIIYPLGILPERFHFLLFLWPPTPVIEFSRDVLVRGLVPSPTAHLYLVIAVAVSLGVGTLMYRRLGPRAAEYV